MLEVHAILGFHHADILEQEIIKDLSTSDHFRAGEGHVIFKQLLKIT